MEAGLRYLLKGLLLVCRIYEPQTVHDDEAQVNLFGGKDSRQASSHIDGQTALMCKPYIDHIYAWGLNSLPVSSRSGFHVLCTNFIFH